MRDQYLDDSYSTREAAELLGVSPDAILKRCNTGDLRAVDGPGRLKRVSRVDVEQQREVLLSRLHAVDARLTPSRGIAGERPVQVPSAVPDSDPTVVETHSDVVDAELSRLRARVRELEASGLGLKMIAETALGLVGQRLVSDTLND